MCRKLFVPLIITHKQLLARLPPPVAVVVGVVLDGGQPKIIVFFASLPPPLAQTFLKTVCSSNLYSRNRAKVLGVFENFSVAVSPPKAKSCSLLEGNFAR